MLESHQPGQERRDGIFIPSGYSVRQFWLLSYRRPVRVMKSFSDNPCCTVLYLGHFHILFPELPRWLVLIGQGEQSAKELT